VFRTNTAYDRWWEGRKLWGQLVNVSRGVAHTLDAQLPADAPERRARYAQVLAEFPSVLAAHLRAPRPVEADDTDAPVRVPVGTSVPNRLVQQLHRDVTADIVAGRLPTEARIAMQPLLQAFDDITGACERIRNTPIPFSYSSYVKQFVLLYALILPFGLVKEFGYGTVIASMFTFFATMGLELLAGEIEEPFGTDRNDLPLDQIAARIAADVRALLLTSPSAE
jgi:putative membrane protein